MRLLLYGNRQECENVCETIKSIAFQSVEHTIVDDFESIHQTIVDIGADVAVVVENGAGGMEAVYKIKESGCNIPVFWFSDDRDFAVQSYRLGCAYFSAKPVTAEKFQKAFTRLSI